MMFMEVCGSGSPWSVSFPVFSTFLSIFLFLLWTNEMFLILHGSSISFSAPRKHEDISDCETNHDAVLMNDDRFYGNHPNLCVTAIDDL